MEQTQTLLRQQDESLDDLHRGIKRVKELGNVMRDELAEQAVILEDLEQDVERTDTSMQMMQKKLGSLVEQTKASDKAMYSIIGCLLVLLGVLTFMVLS